MVTVQIAGKKNGERVETPYTLRVCAGTGCHSNRSDRVQAALEEELKQRGLEHECTVKSVGCMGLCAAGPVVTAQPTGRLFRDATVEQAPLIIDQLAEPKTADDMTHLPFFKRQTRIVLENCGIIDPERIDEYIDAGGYAALTRALTELTPNEVIEEIMTSGLRGRGGAGYPTGLKWSTVAKAGGAEKYVICNADEGDPGAFMDRSVLESDPHRVLEGMIIGAYAVGATKGHIYVRAEYPLAIARLKTAIKQAEKNGYLGSQICGSPFSFRVEISLGAGAFVCGEETALISSLEGLRGTPRPRPPYPAQHGLWGCPTLINNVETFANIPPILRNGGKWFAGIGTETSKGTKVFALAGRVNYTGLIEVPMGITLREVIFEIGGGIPDGKRFKAVQTGGPSGGCIPEQCLDIPVDYESLRQVGSIMGSGGMVVMDETSSMVDVARYFMEFSMTESCGKCIPCRVGTAQLHDLLGRFINNIGTERDLLLLEELCDVMRNTSLCGLGQAAPNPILSTLRYFRNEYLERMIRTDESMSEAACAVVEVGA